MKIIGQIVKKIRSAGIKFHIALLFSSLALIVLGALITKSSLVSAQQAEEATPSATLQIPSYSKLAIELAEIPTAEEEADYTLDAKEEFFASRLIVKYKAGVSDDDKRSIARSQGAKYIREDLDLLGAKVLRVDPQLRDSVFESLKNNPNVEYVEKEAVFRFSENIIPPDCGAPNDPLYCSGDQWALSAISATAGWRLNKGSSAVTIAVVDTGVDYNHADLGNRVIKGYNLTVSPASPDYFDPMDNFGHGTFIAGIIGALTNNARNMAGIDWNSKMLAIKIGEGGVVAAPSIIASGINSAANQFPDLNVRVISLSISGNGSPSLKLAVEDAQNKGIVVVAGANHPADANGNCFIGFPAAYSGVISVVGLNEANQRVSGCTQTSSGGVNYQGIQISAPSTSLHSLNNGGGTRFVLPGSTSYATPFVSGVASILSSCSGNVASDLKNGAVDIGASGVDSATGYGKVNLWKALVQSCNPVLGDVSCSGGVNSTDALYILRYVVGLATGTYGTCPVNIPNEIYLPQADVNGDGGVDAVDALFVLQYSAGTRNLQTQSLVPPIVDTDGDGMTDGQEAQYSCLNPNASDAAANPDNDSVSVVSLNINVNMNNAAELAIGTNPCVADTDSDGFKDGVEVYVGTDANVKCGYDAWPPDIDNNAAASVLDILKFKGKLPSLVGTSPELRRFDLNADGAVNVGDILWYKGKTPVLCTQFQP